MKSNIKFKFVINPVPLKRKHKILLKNLKKRLLKNKINFSYEYTTKERNAVTIAKIAVANDFNVVVACGGDGTVRDAINGLYGSDAVLAILPFGTSNDFAKHLGLSLSNAVGILFNGKEKLIDLGLVEFVDKNVIFCSTSGIGFDGKLLKLNNYTAFIKMKKFFGNIVYPLFGFLMLTSYKSKEAEIMFGKKAINTKLFMLNANFVRSMGGMRVTPNADVCNNAFDIFIVSDAPALKRLAGLVWYAFTSAKLNFKEIKYLSNIKEFSISSNSPIEIQLNGDFIGYTPAKFRILPKALKLLV